MVAQVAFPHSQRPALPPTACRQSASSALLASPRKLQRQAQEVIDARIDDPSFMAQLVQSPQFTAYLAKSLKAKVQRDAWFAELVLSLPGAVASATPRGVAATPSVASMPSPSPRATPTGRGGRGLANRTPTSKLAFITEESSMETPVIKSGSTRKRGGASVLARSGTARSPLPFAASSGVGTKATAQRSLLHAFDDESEDSKETKVRVRSAATPAKLRRMEQSVQRQGDAASWREDFLAPLPSVVAAQVASFLSFQDTVRLESVVSGAAAVLRQPVAWDPLVLEAEECGRLLRRLRSRDPCAKLDPAAYPLPAAAALMEVKMLRAELPEPDHLKLPEDDEESSSEAFAAASSTRATAFFKRAAFELVMDPLEELTRRLRRGWLPDVAEMEIRNIEVSRMDFAFLGLRARPFGSFLQLELRYDGLDHERYSLLACRSLKGTALPCRARAAADNASRWPPEAASALLHPPAENVNDEEALFLQEHAAMFKSGDNFHFVHAPWRSIAGAQVHQRYAPRLLALQTACRDVRS
eukprot:TRINITY_DN52445_c0_g1_i1.p1 TRINITY_DN52445_c0_g1~~TRINITY_DN52445_c0_g1_i1.p1  ORF type:complete len:529 (-),score=109.25 TRINITY_DN52445_c0_g1_i1:63-1649(-)